MSDERRQGTFVMEFYRVWYRSPRQPFRTAVGPTRSEINALGMIDVLRRQTTSSYEFICKHEHWLPE